MLVLRKINYQKTFRNMEIFRRNASNHPLSIETSCDDTGNAIMKGNQILSDKIHTQLESNSFGGIIPPVAADIHRKNIERVIKESFEEAAISINDLDAIAVTNRPGLGMSLRIGLRYAKHLSRKFQKPLIPIHHMEAHALTARIENEINFPFLCLLISGGHSLLTFVNNVDDFKLLGDSIDDAPGEAFDKIARFLKLRNLKEFENKSGGKSIEDAAKKCIKPSDCYDFPFMLSRYRDCQFSFAGLKNKAKRHIIKQTNTLDLDIDQVIPDYEDFCANFQGAVARHICNRTQRAMEYCEKKQMFKSNDNKTLVISGGVACNDFIYEALSQLCELSGFTAIRPSKKLCTDNGIMIAWNGVERFNINKDIYHHTEIDEIDIFPKCQLGENLIDQVKNENLACKWAKIPILKPFARAVK